MVGGMEKGGRRRLSTSGGRKNNNAIMKQGFVSILLEGRDTTVFYIHLRNNEHRGTIFLAPLEMRTRLLCTRLCTRLCTHARTHEYTKNPRHKCTQHPLESTAKHPPPPSHLLLLSTNSNSLARIRQELSDFRETRFLSQPEILRT